MSDLVPEAIATTSEAETCRAISNADIIWSANSLEASSSARALLFESRGLLFAVSANAVTEVIEATDTSEVPGAPEWYRGVSLYRSQPAALIDVAKFLQPESPPLEFNRAIAVRVASSTYLLAVEKILNLCNLPADWRMKPKAESGYNTQHHSESHSPPEPPPEHALHRAIRGVCRYDNRSLALIDLPELLRCTKLLHECSVT